MAAPLWKHWNSDLKENFVKIHDETSEQAKGLGQGASQFNK